jgi:transcription initiation factor TFIIIB Brf1 subunit/transcription initiation factor TFIIB
VGWRVGWSWSIKQNVLVIGHRVQPDSLLHFESELFESKATTMDRCPNCGGEMFEEDPVRGDSICKDCGCCLPELDAGIVAAGSNKLQRTQKMVESAAVVTKERNLTDNFHNITQFENHFLLPRVVLDSAGDLMTAQPEARQKGACCAVRSLCACSGVLGTYDAKQPWPRWVKRTFADS